jgi:hypothetical protein
MERRPVAYVLVANARTVLVVALVIPLVTAGLGVEGALAGMAGGTALALLIGLGATRASFTLALDRRELAPIVRRAGLYLPIVVSFWVIQQMDLFLLSRYVPKEDVGFYRIAGLMAGIVPFVVSALMMAWSPLTRTPIFAAAGRERGRTAIGGVMTTYFALVAIGLILALTVAADSLIQIAPPAYSDAAPLIPLLGAGFATYGGFALIYRAADFPRKRRAYVTLAVASAAVFLVAALVLIPMVGPYGAGLAVIIGFTSGSLGLIYLSQRGPTPIPFAYRRVAAAAGLALSCFLAGRGLGALTGDWQPAVEAAALLAFPVLLLATGVVPPAHARALKAMAGAVLPRRRAHVPSPSLAGLEPAERDALRMLVRDRVPAHEATRSLAPTQPAAYSRLVAALRRIGRVGEPSEADLRIGAYLFSAMPVAERDVLARRMWKEGVDPLEVVALEEALSSLSRVPGWAWESTGARMATATDGRESPSRPPVRDQPMSA